MNVHVDAERPGPPRALRALGGGVGVHFGAPPEENE
jgi:hypothetical protein